ncbi:hypothetical protein CDD83_1496 [Cordyceps sp. RAO-2017]|nr:hypothetical protein CDD83_1496 [Cordyceps sp. RAO-2017]
MGDQNSDNGYPTNSRYKFATGDRHIAPRPTPSKRASSYLFREDILIQVSEMDASDPQHALKALPLPGRGIRQGIRTIRDVGTRRTRILFSQPLTPAWCIDLGTRIDLTARTRIFWNQHDWTLRVVMGQGNKAQSGEQNRVPLPVEFVDISSTRLSVPGHAPDPPPVPQPPPLPSTRAHASSSTSRALAGPGIPS